MPQTAAREGWTRRAVGVVLATVFVAVAARGEDSRSAFPAGSNAACLPSDADRLSFLEGRLDERATYARWWWTGWNTAFVLGMGVQSARATLADDRGDRAEYISSAIQATIGLTRNLWRPPYARKGSSELLDLPPEDPERCTERLERAEQLMQRNAKQAVRERKTWPPHVVNLALNLGFAAIVAEVYDHRAAYYNAALGIAIGEARILSYPWHAESDWEDYRELHPDRGPQTPELTWTLAPWRQGLQVVFRY